MPKTHHHHSVYISKINMYICWKNNFKTSTKEFLTLHNFCIHYTNVMFFGALKPWKYENLTSLIISSIIPRHISKRWWFGVTHLTSLQKRFVASCLVVSLQHKVSIWLWKSQVQWISQHARKSKPISIARIQQKKYDKNGKKYIFIIYI